MLLWGCNVVKEPNPAVATLVAIYCHGSQLCFCSSRCAQGLARLCHSETIPGAQRGKNTSSFFPLGLIDSLSGCDLAAAEPLQHREGEGMAATCLCTSSLLSPWALGEFVWNQFIPGVYSKEHTVSFPQQNLASWSVRAARFLSRPMSMKQLQMSISDSKRE